MNAHVDVASYALGVLDEHEARLFEEHLADCGDCAAELESMIPVVALMSEVDVRDLADPGPGFGEEYEERYDDGMAEGRRLRSIGNPAAPVRPGARPERVGRSAVPPEPPLRDDRPARRPRHTVLLLAAAAVVLGVLTAGGVMASNGWFRTSSPPVAGGEPTTQAPIEGDRFEATDADTGVRADVVLAGKPWGTRVAFDVSEVEGPRTCRLVAVTSSGKKEVLSTWKVPPSGYGTDEQPKALSLEASTALNRDDIAELQVQEVREDGSTSTLVSLES